MAKLTLTDIASGYASISAINANWALIEQALENTFSRDGTSPNTLGANLDMNSNRVINLASPIDDNDAARWADITSLASLTGLAVPSLSGNSTKVLSNNGTNLNWASGVTISSSGNVDITVSSSYCLSLTKGAGSGGIVGLSNGTGSYSLSFSTNDAFLTTTSAHSLILGTNNTSRVTISSSGNLTVAAPSSGTTLALTSVASGTGLSVTDGTVTGALSFGSSIFTVGATSAHSVQVQANSVQRLLFDSANGYKAKFSVATYSASSSVSFSATPTFDANTSNYFDFGALTANVTSCTISGASAGQTIKIRVKQDATGGRSFALPAGAQVTGNVTTTASGASVLTLTYTGTDSRWEGAWNAVTAQTLTDVSGSRSFATNYTNTTGQQIMVAVVGTFAASAYIQALVDSFVVSQSFNYSGGSAGGALSFEVPPGSVYRVNSSGSVTAVTWAERR